MDKLFLFNDERHEYTVDGKVIPSVTQILQDVGLIDLSAIPADRLEAAREFGIAVHSACELSDKGELDESTLDDNLVPYLEAWNKFKKDTHIFLLECERPFFSSTYGFAGTPDRIGMISLPTIIDIKSTAGLNPITELQTAGYGILYEENKIGQRSYNRMGVLLKPDGTYKVHKYRNESDKNSFLSCLAVYNLKRRYLK
jgi:hypothetical protein